MDKLRLKRAQSWLVAAGIAGACLSACATQQDQAPGGPGFLLGCFHGAIAILVLIAAPLTHLRIYAFPNDGFPYDLGFCIGFVASLGIFILSIMPRVGGWLTGRS